MDLGSILFILALCLLAGAYIARPFLESQARDVTRRERMLSQLAAERERVLAAILELDQDFAMGKLERDDYEAQRGALVAQGARALRQIDELPPPEPEEAGPVEPKAAPPSASNLEAEVEAAVSRFRREARDSAGYCTQCGAPIQAADRFCTRCGAPVGLETEATQA